MKKSWSIVLFLLLVSFLSVNAQEKGAMEAYVGYGVQSSNKLSEDLGQGLSSLFSGIFLKIFTGQEGYSYEAQGRTGPIMGSVRYAVGRRWMLGVSLAYERSKVGVKYNNRNIGEQKNTYHTIAVEGDFRWVSNEDVQLYSGLSIGYGFKKEDFRSTSHTHESEEMSDSFSPGHLTLVGARVGGPVGFHLELGFGYKGLFNTGFSAQW